MYGHPVKRYRFHDGWRNKRQQNQTSSQHER